MTQINVGKIVGKVDGKYWAQVHDFSHGLRGRLLAIITLEKTEGESEVAVVARGRDVLSHLHELYFGQTEASVYDQLFTAVSMMVSQEPSLQLDCAVLLDEALYLVSCGGGVWLRQDQKEGWLLKPEDIVEIRKLSGPAAAGQRLVLGNRLFWQHVPAGVVRAALESDLEQAVETLGAVVHGSQKSQGEAGIIIEIAQAPSPKPQFVVRQEEELVIETPPPTGKSLDWLAAKFPKRTAPVFVQYGKSKTSKTLIIGIIFLLIFGVLGIVGRARFQYLVSGRAKLDQRSEELNYKFNEAKALVPLNPVRSSQMLAEIKDTLADIRAKGGVKYKNPSLDSLELELPTVINKSKGINEIAPTEILDLTLIRDGFSGQKMAIQDDKLMVLDSISNRVIVVDPVKKSGAVLVGSDVIGGASLIAAYPGKTEILSKNGIVECSVLITHCSVKIKFDEDWGEVVDMGMFAGNIYLLTKTNIWRYQSGEAGYGNKQNWIAKSETVDLSGSTTLAIDGSLWIVNGQNIVKLTRGVKEAFEISGLEKPLGINPIIYTNEDAENLYILDRTNSRVVTIKKTGEYSASYLSSSLAGTTSLVVNEKAGRVYLLAGSKIWQIEI
ncbi:MAG: hypothetical protein AAB768_02405 [Patescibacteria group bacterium]